MRRRRSARTICGRGVFPTWQTRYLPAIRRAHSGLDTNTNAFTADDAEQWVVRGAINAGLAVFLYVKSLEKMNPPPDYNQCAQLP